jgi:rRNA-processing protein FCF1
LEAARTRITTVASELERHRTFDLPRQQGELARLKEGIAGKTSELALVADRKRRVDEILTPLVQEMQNLESRKRQARSDLDSAEELDRRLSAAPSSYERAMIHEQCERRFGTGSPRKIIGGRQREVRQLERDYNKASRRVEEVARTAARQIDTVVIDGNNLCYEGNRFIGLAAVEALLPSLSRMCAVVVVFDSAIRRLLNTDDSALQGRLASHAKVHVVASRRMADETVLDLASASEFTYVLSNDRFGDFNEKAAVKGGRVIRHEIVNGNVFVHDLQLRAAYR